MKKISSPKAAKIIIGFFESKIIKFVLKNFTTINYIKFKVYGEEKVPKLEDTEIIHKIIDNYCLLSKSWGFTPNTKYEFNHTEDRKKSWICFEHE